MVQYQLLNNYFYFQAKNKEKISCLRPKSLNELPTELSSFSVDMITSESSYFRDWIEMYFVICIPSQES